VLRLVWHSIKFFVLSLLLFTSLLSAQAGGRIEGKVLDENGLPVPGAIVSAYAVSNSVRHSLIPEAETDSAGHFVIAHLNWGRYKVVAKKENSAYPNTFFAFYGTGASVETSVTENSPTSDIVIRVGPKAATLTGSVSRAGNSAPINATFKLTRLDSPDNWISTSLPPNYSVLLPASVNVAVEVSAPGYEVWTSASPIRLNPSSTEHLDIVMHPNHDPNLHRSKFLVPDGYIGWLLLEFKVDGAPPVPTENSSSVFKFGSSGELETSSDGPDRGADDEYLYYSTDGSKRTIPRDYATGQGMIWGQFEGTRKGIVSQFGFFVGSEELYKKYQFQATHPGPVARR